METEEIKPEDLDEIYCCEKCGSTEVEEKVWVDCNTRIEMDVCENDGLGFCTKCGDECKIVTLKEFNEISKTEKEEE